MSDDLPSNVALAEVCDRQAADDERNGAASRARIFRLIADRLRSGEHPQPAAEGSSEWPCVGFTTDADGNEVMFRCDGNHYGDPTPAHPVPVEEPPAAELLRVLRFWLTERKNAANRSAEECASEPIAEAAWDATWATFDDVLAFLDGHLDSPGIEAEPGPS